MKRRSFMGFLAGLPFLGKLTAAYGHEEKPVEKIEEKAKEAIPNVADNDGDIAFIRSMLDTPFFRRVTREWSKHIETGRDATSFANAYLEFMRDPQDDEARKLTATFAAIMNPREWPDMLRIIEPIVYPDVLRVFKSSEAADFYASFRAIIIEQIRDYWEQFLNRRTEYREKHD